MLSKNGREARVGCLVRDEATGDVGRVTYVEGNVVVHRLCEPSASGTKDTVSAAFRRSDLTVLEEGPLVPERELPDYHPYAATWDVGGTDDTAGIYHVAPGSDHFDKNRPLVAIVAVNPDLGADARQVLSMMACAPQLWRELREVASKYIWGPDARENPDAMDDFARITNLLIGASDTFPWDGVNEVGDGKIDARNTEIAAAKASGGGEAVKP
jgi:hypothetical protein